MSGRVYKKILETPGAESKAWESFHENSKLGKFQIMAASEELVRQMDLYAESLGYEQHPELPLPEPTPVTMELGQAIRDRFSCRELAPGGMTANDAAAILHLGYGVNRDNTGTEFPRDFRNCPSGGALYPLEIYFHTPGLDGLAAGLYHYNPTTNSLRVLMDKDHTTKLAELITQPELALGHDLLVFITAQFERTIFKYKERGYRFVLLEAGHLAQNMSLIATGLDLGHVCIGGYLDREVDKFLGLDGLTHSTIYMLGFGKIDDKPE